MSTTVVLCIFDCLVVNLKQDSSKKERRRRGRKEGKKIDGGGGGGGERVGPDDIERVNGNIETVAAFMASSCNCLSTVARRHAYLLSCHAAAQLSRYVGSHGHHRRHARRTSR